MKAPSVCVCWRCLRSKLQCIKIFSRQSIISAFLPTQSRFNMSRKLWNLLCWFVRFVSTDAGITEKYLNGSLNAVAIILTCIGAPSVLDLSTLVCMDVAINAGMLIGMALSGRYTDWISSKQMIFLGTTTTACCSLACAFVSMVSIKKYGQLHVLKVIFAVLRSGLGFGLGVEFVGTFVMDSDNAFHLIKGREWRSLLYSDNLQYNLGILLSHFIPFVLVRSLYPSNLPIGTLTPV